MHIMLALIQGFFLCFVSFNPTLDCFFPSRRWFTQTLFFKTPTTSNNTTNYHHLHLIRVIMLDPDQNIPHVTPQRHTLYPSHNKTFHETQSCPWETDNSIRTIKCIRKQHMNKRELWRGRWVLLETYRDLMKRQKTQVWERHLVM